MFLKIHRSPDNADVVAVCDRELMNTTIRDGDLEVCISGSFYGDRIASEHEVAEALKKADNANIMGERSVALAVSLGIVSRSSCTRIGSVPHALVFRL